jgi:hypothetical protein
MRMLVLTDEEKAALFNLLLEVIVADPAPPSPRVQMLRAILAKLRSLGPDLQTGARSDRGAAGARGDRDRGTR